MFDTNDTIQDRRNEARLSFSGRRLTEYQFEEYWAVTAIMARQIIQAGVFREKLTNYAQAIAKSEGIEELKAEETIRDIFKIRYGETMNQKRTRLMDSEDIDGGPTEEALLYAQSVIGLIQQPPTMPYSRAVDQVAVAMAKEHDITEVGSKKMMKKAFASHYGRELYEAGKEAEALYHKPTREAEALTERKSVKQTQKRQVYD